MTGNRYSNEFKSEAVAQVIYRCYSIREATKRVGVSQYSLDKWVKRARQQGEQSSNSGGSGSGKRTT